MKKIKLIIILIAAILLWRGVWGLADQYLFSDNQLLSYISSIIIGLILLKLAHLSLKHIE